VAVDGLGQYLARAPQVKTLDWGALVSADLPAAQALLDVVEDWSGRSVVFRFVGAGVLRRRLKGSTPSGRRENDPVWWRLRLAVLRLMDRAEEFDLAALDFCVTYGVVPPTWSAAQARYEGVETMPATPGLDMAVDSPASVLAEPIKPLVTQLGGMDVLEWPALAPDSQLMDVPDLLDPTGKAEELFAAPALTGVLAGDVSGPLSKLDKQLVHHVPGGPFVIDCQQLLRIDFAAAGHLMQWLMGVGARGITVELRGVGRLVAAFLHVVGVDETVPVQLRKY
jgi:ABC-type transporter Mla MlaB component